MLYSGLSLGTKHTIVFKLNVISGQSTLNIPHDLSELVLWYLRCMLLLQVNMSMRRPRDQNSSKLAASRSRVIDFKDGYMMGDDAAEHLPVEAMPIKHSDKDIQFGVDGEPTNSDYLDRAKAMVERAGQKAKELAMTAAEEAKKKAAAIKERVVQYLKDKKHGKDQTPETAMAHHELDQMSHHIATNVMELVDSDVNAFSDKYLSAFPPDSITQQQLDTMLSLGQDVFNTSLCKHVNMNLGADYPKTKKSSTGESKWTHSMRTSMNHHSACDSMNRIRSGVGASRLQTSTHENAPDTPADERDKQPCEDEMENEREEMDNKDMDNPDASHRKLNRRPDMHVPGTAAKYSLQDMQPRLKQAVTETLDAYGIKENGIIDTKKLARVYQLQSMLRA